MARKLKPGKPTMHILVTEKTNTYLEEEKQRMGKDNKGEVVDSLIEFQKKVVNAHKKSKEAQNGKQKSTSK